MTTFLSAEWRKLLMVNYVVDQKILQPFLPARTEMDLWNGNCYVSLVGFMFVNTELKGIRIPFHTDFEEVNLRFYVRFHDGEKWKRGVVFVKEIVPKPALTLVANTLYGENYETMPMRHSWKQGDGDVQVTYQWKKKGWHTVEVVCHSTSCVIQEGSEEEFITEHYWGYTRINDNTTSEYEVAHPRWDVYAVKDYTMDVNFGTVYGTGFSFLTSQTPKSVFLAEGSEITVMKGRRL